MVDPDFVSLLDLPAKRSLRAELPRTDRLLITQQPNCTFPSHDLVLFYSRDLLLATNLLGGASSGYEAALACPIARQGSLLGSIVLLLDHEFGAPGSEYVVETKLMDKLKLN